MPAVLVSSEACVLGSQMAVICLHVVLPLCLHPSPLVQGHKS